jgi:hypothetical protein
MVDVTQLVALFPKGKVIVELFDAYSNSFSLPNNSDNVSYKVRK